MTMFDIEGDMLSYTSDRNINSVLLDMNPDEGDIKDSEQSILSGQRSKVKIGRLRLNVILVFLYGANHCQSKNDITMSDLTLPFLQKIISLNK